MGWLVLDATISTEFTAARSTCLLEELRFSVSIWHLDLSRIKPASYSVPTCINIKEKLLSGSVTL